MREIINNAITELEQEYKLVTTGLCGVSYAIKELPLNSVLKLVEHILIRSGIKYSTLAKHDNDTVRALIVMLTDDYDYVLVNDTSEVVQMCFAIFKPRYHFILYKYGLPSVKRYVQQQKNN